MPKIVAAKIVKLQRRFFWGGLNGESKCCPSVKWADIELPKELGGLGVGNIMHKNLILLFKWWWRFSESDNTLWKRIIKSVHDINGEMASRDTFRNARTGLWSNFLTNDPDTVKLRSIIEEGMTIRVGNGKSILFWHDIWCRAGVLKHVFPRLFRISIQQHCQVSHMGEWVGSSWVWHLEWRRPLYDWETEEVRALQLIIEHNGPKQDTENGLMWRNAELTSYPTKAISAIFNASLGSSMPKSLVSVVWQKLIPPRAQLTVWLAYKEKLKTGDLLVEKGIISPQNAGCPFCRTELETNTHILFTCRFAWNTWMEILKWWNLSAPLHMTFSKFSEQWLGLIKERKCKDIWIISLGCVVWSLWYERNQIKFERKSINFQPYFVWQNLLEYSPYWEYSFCQVDILTSLVSHLCPSFVSNDCARSFWNIHHIKFLIVFAFTIARIISSFSWWKITTWCMDQDLYIVPLMPLLEPLSHFTL